jgi:hypothetical protein
VLVLRSAQLDVLQVSWLLDGVKQLTKEQWEAFSNEPK